MLRFPVSVLDSLTQLGDVGKEQLMFFKAAAVMSQVEMHHSVGLD